MCKNCIGIQHCMHMYIVQICCIFSTKAGLQTTPIAPLTYYRCVRCGDVYKYDFDVQLDNKSTGG
jgi:hypothetical protein